MTTRTNTTNFHWMLACSFVLSLAWSGLLGAAETEAELKVAIRPSAIQPDYNPGPTTNPTPNNSQYFGDEYRPDIMDGPPTYTAPPKPSAEEERQQEISSRYQDPRMLGFLQNSSMNQIMSLYNETSRLIDSRHVSPLSYEERTRQALENLIAALENPEFLQAAGYRSTQSTRSVQAELERLKNSPARSANEALGLMQWAAALASRQLGVRQEAVALEFFNSTLDSLDRYTAFVPAKTGLAPSAALEEQIVGIGVELKAHDNGALVFGVLENSPAAESRMQRGDLITAVDGRSVRGMSLNQIGEMIGGRAGTSVQITIDRDGRQATARLTRRSVYVSSVAGTQMLSGNTGYLRLKQFSESSKEDMERAMWQLHNAGMQALILDLRGNGGGLLTEAIDVSNLFLPEGRIVATRGRNASDNTDERASFSKTWRVPMVVLVDGNSASASEIFAAAIQENGRGVIVGRHSYGKGTVQTHFPLRTASGDLKLTTAKFYSPNGREMAGAGVTPDVIVRQTGEPFAADIVRDTDVAAALQVVASGSPADLASQSGQRQLRN
jgi:carboxyl-terminal processing protease